MQTWTAIIIIIQNGIMKHESHIKADYALLICLQKQRDFIFSVLNVLSFLLMSQISFSSIAAQWFIIKLKQLFQKNEMGK